MTDDEPKSPRWELVKLVIRSQSSWIVGALGIAAAIMTFVAIGEWGLLWLLIALLVIALIAQHRYMASRVSVATAASTASNHAEDPATAHSPDPQNVDNEYSVGEPQTEDVTADPLAESSEESRNEGEFPAAVEAATRGDLRATREHATTWIEEAEEEEDRHKRRVLREMLLSRAGDESALTRLGQLADARPNDPWTQQMFALDLEHNGALRRAAEEVEERTEAMKDGNGRTALLTVEARIRRKLGELERAQECCRLALAEAKTESTALAHRIMGECWSDEGQPFLALAHWTESLQENPNDGYLRFEVAYKASNEGLDDLSIMYYLVLDRTDRASSVAQNNLGVELRARQAIFTGTDYWRKAAERGSALAAGNIANVLVAGGFASEALEWAERGRTMDDESPRIGEAVQRVARQRDEEQETIGQLESNGRDVEAFLLKLVNDDPSTELPEGRYQNHVGETFEFVREGDSSLGSGPSSVTYTVDRDAEGLVVGRKKNQYANSERGICVCLPNEMKMLFPRKGGAAGVITFRKVGVPEG